MLKLLLWDLDSTLLDYDLPERNSIMRCFEDFGLGSCPQKFLDDYHVVNLSWWLRAEKGEFPKERIIVARFEQMLSDFGYDASIAEAFNLDYMTHLGDTVCPIRNGLETLGRLRGRVIQGIATNGMVVAQKGKLHNSGIDALVDYVFISEAVGADKPSGLFYDRILSQFPDISRNEVMMVGDSLSSDMTGANNAGIMSCWFNPSHKALDRPLRIDYEIDDLSQVIGIVDSLS